MILKIYRTINKLEVKLNLTKKINYLDKNIFILQDWAVKS